MKLSSNFITKISNLKQTSNLILYLESFFATWAIMRIGNLHSMNIIAFLFFLLCVICFSAMEKEFVLQTSNNKKIHKIVAGILSAIFTCFYLSDTAKSLVSDLNNKLFQMVILLAVAIGLYILLYKAVRYLMCKMNQFEIKDSTVPHKFEAKNSTIFHKLITKDSTNAQKFISHLPFISFILIVLCRIPWLLYSYPGIMTPDSINQFRQVVGISPFSNHHPWVHTLTIALFYHIGSLFTSNVNDAFLFFTIFQICFMAFAASYLIWVISKYTKSLPLLGGIIAFYAILPYHNVMALCIWKDVMFGGTLLLFCTSLFYLLKEGIKKQNLVSIVLYFVSGILMCLYRTNGWYAFIVTFPFLLIAFRKNWKIMLPLHIALLALVLFVKGPVMEHYDVEQPDFVESISIPLQQVGRVIATGQELTPEQETLIKKIIKTEYVPELYTEHISDNMKELVRTYHPEYLITHKSDYFKLWIELGLKYPDIYYDAYIAQTRGYYSPSAVYSVAEVDGVIDNETGLYREYLLRGKLIVKIREILIKLQDIIPLYGALWSMGSLFWGTLLFLALTLGQKTSFTLKEPMNFLDLITVWMPNIAVIGTLLIATPVAIEFRYAYNLAYSIPLYFAVMLIPSKKYKNN